VYRRPEAGIKEARGGLGNGKSGTKVELVLRVQNEVRKEGRKKERNE